MANINILHTHVNKARHFTSAVLVTSRHVLVFSNAIYHDNGHARYCYCGHFKIQRIIIYYKLFRFFECILRILFPSTDHKCTTPLYAAPKTHAHSDVNKHRWEAHGRTSEGDALNESTFTLWQQMALMKQQKYSRYPGNPVNIAAALLPVSETYSHSDFCISNDVNHCAKYLNI